MGILTRTCGWAEKWRPGLDLSLSQLSVTEKATKSYKVQLRESMWGMSILVPWSLIRLFILIGMEEYGLLYRSETHAF